MQCTFNLRIFQKEPEIMQKKQHSYINFFRLSIKYLLEITYRTANIERVKFCSLCFLSNRLIKKLLCTVIFMQIC